MRIGSLFSGIDGLALGLERAGLGRTTWQAEVDPNASSVLASHWPDVPNLDDVALVDWSKIEPVDVLCGGFPCFAAGTLILTTDGYTPIEDVEIGASVLTHRGRWRRVTATMQRVAATRRIVTVGGERTVTTDEHPFYVRLQQRGQWDNTHRRYPRAFVPPQWVAANEIGCGWRAGFVLPKGGRTSISPDVWWIVGRYLADGWTTQRRKTGAGNPTKTDQGRVVFGVGRKKLDEFRTRLDAAGFHATEVSERTVVKFHVQNQVLYQLVQPFGKGALNKRLPGWCLSLPQPHAEALLAGWLSGDGHQERKTGLVQHAAMPLP